MADLFLCWDVVKHSFVHSLMNHISGDDRSNHCFEAKIKQGAMGRRIDPSWGEPIDLFLVPASALQLVQQRPWYVLSCLWDGAYKRTLAANRKE